MVIDTTLIAVESPARGATAARSWVGVLRSAKLGRVDEAFVVGTAKAVGVAAVGVSLWLPATPLATRAATANEEVTIVLVCFISVSPVPSP
ncbi:MAG TPA: hypothetical protein VFK56_18955, partial [Mycobacterium sp.]|nr:hypothetical protein [Mycobacterium sp.]